MFTEFVRRTHLYQNWDRQLSARTRFFGAAAHTNAAFAQWCRMPRPIRAFCDESFEFLAAAGYYLEGLNRTLAGDITLQSERGPTLDHALVTLEQLALERFLNGYARRQPAEYQRTVAQLNRLLFCLGETSAPLPIPASVRLYKRTLRLVRQRLGRSIHFPRLDDRIWIGRTLVNLIAAQPAHALDCPGGHGTGAGLAYSTTVSPLQVSVCRPEPC